MRERAAERGAASQCLCCEAEFVFTIGSGGLCEPCNEGQCPNCGDDEVWL